MEGEVKVKVESIFLEYGPSAMGKPAGSHPRPRSGPVAATGSYSIQVRLQTILFAVRYAEFLEDIPVVPKSSVVPSAMAGAYARGSV